jgi:hypothetical protein
MTPCVSRGACKDWDLVRRLDDDVGLGHALDDVAALATPARSDWPDDVAAARRRLGRVLGRRQLAGVENEGCFVLHGPLEVGDEGLLGIGHRYEARRLLCDLGRHRRHGRDILTREAHLSRLRPPDGLDAGIGPA